MARLTLVLIVLLSTLSACSAPASPSGIVDPVIITSTTLLADIARKVAGDRVSIDSLLPTGADPHSYQPTPQDIAKIERSSLLIVNGMGYEQFLAAWSGNASAEKKIIETATGIHPGNDAEGNVDPHVWLDPNNVITYVENIREALIHFDPGGAAIYQSNAEAYVKELKRLDEWITGQVNEIPSERRLLVTNHEALGYFAKRYGFTVVGTVLESYSTDASPSAKQLASLIKQIKTSGAPAIFLDAGDNTLLAAQIADETGVQVVNDLHLESLTKGAPAATYLDLMKHNVTQIVNGLK